MSEPTNVEEVRPNGEANEEGAVASPDLQPHVALERSITARTLLLVSVLAAIFAAWAPVLGFDVLLGGLCGIGNLILVRRANERLLNRESSMRSHQGGSIGRVFAFGAVSVVCATIGPWWGMGIYFAGFFLPFVLYVRAAGADSGQR